MPRRNRRTRSLKRLDKSLPGGRHEVQYRREASALQFCFVCGQPLAGFSHKSTSAVHKPNRSRTRVSRPFGGQVCSDCLKEKIREAARKA